MADTITRRTFQKYGVFYFALPWSCFQNNIFYPVLDAQDLSAETHHCRREEQVLMFPGRVECLLNLRKRFHSYQLARLKIERLPAEIAGRSGHKLPRFQLANMCDLVVERNQ